MKHHSFVSTTLRMLCSTPDFGDQLLSMITPLDTCVLLYVFDLRITDTQYRRYMGIWRQFFLDKGWALEMLSHGLEISLVGNDLITLSSWMKKPSLMDARRRPRLHLDLRIVQPAASRRFPLWAYDNLDCLYQEKWEYLEHSVEFVSFAQTLEHGIIATHPDLILGEDLEDKRTTSLTWLSLTVSKAIKHKAFDPVSPYFSIRTRPNCSITLGYGRKTMQKLRVPQNYRQDSTEVELGLMIDLKTAASLDNPFPSRSPASWKVLVLEDRCKGSGAYILREERFCNYVDVFENLSGQHKM